MTLGSQNFKLPDFLMIWFLTAGGNFIAAFLGADIVTKRDSYFFGNFNDLRSMQSFDSSTNNWNEFHIYWFRVNIITLAIIYNLFIVKWYICS